MLKGYSNLQHIYFNIVSCSVSLTLMRYVTIYFICFFKIHFNPRRTLQPLTRKGLLGVNIYRKSKLLSRKRQRRTCQVVSLPDRKLAPDRMASLSNNNALTKKHSFFSSKKEEEIYKVICTLLVTQLQWWGAFFKDKFKKFAI